MITTNRNKIAVTIATLTLASTFFVSNLLHAEIAVIVNPSLALESIDPSTASNIFLGKSNNLSDGTKIKPLDQEEGEGSRDEFYSKVVKKDASQLNAYWSRLIFTGKGQPPKAVLDDDEVIEIISADSSYIGYINASAVDESVKVLLTIP